MSTPMNHEELVELLQEGKIGYLRFVLEGENGQDYLEWWRGGRADPKGEEAGGFVGETGKKQKGSPQKDSQGEGIRD